MSVEITQGKLTVTVEVTQAQIDTIGYALQCVFTEIRNNYEDTEEDLDKLEERVDDVYSAFGNLI